MVEKIKINFGNEVVEATPVDVNSASEYFNQDGLAYEARGDQGLSYRRAL
jgi:hypothetical protein